jgi:peptidoglycan/xylan/chitin deacetylase (PgdA/CDA1 family)
MRHAVKRVLGQTVFASHLDAVLLRNAAVVVAFHRVQETAEPDDGLTVSVRMFERHCRFFRRHFRVVPLGDIVKKLEHGQRLNRELAITFDDGYRDNFEAAAPVLEKLSLPATFFVVTQSIGTDSIPWWDRERGVRHAWMTWDQVRELRRKGFDVGAHTRTHADLGRISGTEAEREIFGGRLELEREIGAPVDLFAYPYGGPEHLTEANREMVKAAGFRCCCSCFGGINTTGGSPFNLPRVPITFWHESPQEFGFEVALGRSQSAGSVPGHTARALEVNGAS